MLDPKHETMVERVAAAMRRRRFERTRRLNCYDPNAGLTETEIDDARAAIEAMREPTPEMTQAWTQTIKRLGNDPAWGGRRYEDALAEAYKDMLQAALPRPASEEGGGDAS